MDSLKVTKPARKGLNLKLKYCGAVIVAAGSASRMEGTDKIMADLCGESVISRTVKAFQDCDAVKEIVIVTRQDLLAAVSNACSKYEKVTAVVVGGKDRAESVNCGLNALSKKVKVAAIHDGARPLIDWQTIDRVVRAGITYGAAAPAVPVKDTVKIVAGGIVKETPDRSALQAVQTPQVFDFDLIRGALVKAREDKIKLTDDCSAVEHMGMSVKIVKGEERNIKITTPMDLQIARMLWEDAQ